jgi:hypothetical protein
MKAARQYMKGLIGSNMNKLLGSIQGIKRAARQ